MEKGRIAQWAAKDGDHVQAEQVVLILETEKVAHEIPAPISGILAILGNAGDEYPCGTVVGIVAETKEEYQSVKNDPAKYGGLDGSGSGQVELTPQEAPLSEAPAQALTAGPSGRIKSSPLARRLAEMHQIDIAALSGSGPEGRIVKRDIERAAEAKRQTQDQKPLAVSSTVPAKETGADFSGKRVKAVIPMTGMRKTIADRLHHSTTVTARVSAMAEVDMTEMVKLRDHLVKKASILGFKVTYTDLIIFMVAKALKAVPIVNSSLIGSEIRIWEDINIGFGVSVMKGENESGLLVPVIRNADRMSLGEISKARKDLMDKARAGTLSLNEMSEGTFTITNTGTFSAMWHIQTPIINQPEAAILGISSIVDRPVVKEGEIVIRPIMPVSFAFDHRIMDGAPPSMFMNMLHQMVEDPWMIIV